MWKNNLNVWIKKVCIFVGLELMFFIFFIYWSCNILLILYSVLDLFFEKCLLMFDMLCMYLGDFFMIEINWSDSYVNDFYISYKLYNFSLLNNN